MTEHSNTLLGHVTHPAQWLDLLVLVALAAVVHQMHLHEWFRPWTPQSMRIVHWIEQRTLNFAGKQVEEGKVGTPQVTLLLVPPDAHADMFCGLTPTPRGQLALVLTKIAGVIKTEMCPAARPVIGIDVDVAPVSARARMVEQCHAAKSARMQEALTELATRADIVAITTPPSGTDPPPPRDAWLKTLPESMRIATPFEWFDVGEPDYRFLAKSKAKVGSLPGYPSLGNLMGMAAHAAAHSASSPNRNKEVVQLIDNLDEPGSAKSLTEAYEWAYLDLLRGSVRVTIRLVSNWTLESEVFEWVRSVKLKDGQGSCPDAGAPALKVRPMLLLALDDGSSDKHFSVMDTSTRSGGSYLQAIRAVSINDPLKPQTDELLWQSTWFDLRVAFFYVLFWAMARLGIRRMVDKGWPAAAALVTFVGPLVLTGVLGWVAAWHSAHLLSEARWVDPLLILIFLTLHAYLTVWELAVERAQKPAHRAGADRGLSLLWRDAKVGFVVAVAMCILWQARG